MGAGGAARTLLNIINHLDRSRFTPVLVTLNYEGNYEAYLNSDIKFIKLNTKRLRSAIIPLAKVIRREQIDIVFSTIPNYNTVAILARLCSFTRAKIVVREAAYLGGTFSANLKLKVYGFLYKLASDVIALSHGVKDNIVKRYNVKAEKIRVIYNPVDLRNIQENIQHGELPEEHQQLFHGESKVIVTAGRLVKDKDHATLLKAFHQVHREVNAQLVILGEGELKDDLKKQAEDLHMQDSVHFIGFQQNPYMYFHHADVFVLSSIREGFGHVLAEALASGTPVVATNAKPGASEVLDHGKYGKLCEVGNDQELASNIVEVLTLDETEKTKLIEKGLERAAQFDARNIVQQYEDTFDQSGEQPQRNFQ